MAKKVLPEALVPDEAISTWVEEEAKTLGTQRRSLGQFLFTVSAGTYAAGLAVAKLGLPGETEPTWLVVVVAVVGLGFSLCASYLALQLALPTLDGNASTAREAYDSQAKGTYHDGRRWFVVWVLEAILTVALVYVALL